MAERIAGLRTALGVLVVPLGAGATAGLFYGSVASRPLWWVAGVLAALHAATLVRVISALGSRVEDPARAQGLASQLEPLVGLAAVLGGLWGLLTPVAAPAHASPWVLGLGMAGIAVAALSSRYAAGTEPSELPEGQGLARWGRLTGWATAWVSIEASARLAGLTADGVFVFVARLLLVGVVILGVQILVGAWPRERPTAPLAGVSPGLLAVCFDRIDPLSSIGDAVQRGLGIDLRTTWAIQFLRAAVEPMVVSIAGLAWLSTGMVRVGPEEAAIHERLGRVVSAEALGPGLHLVLPWPIDRLRRVPVQRVLTMPVGAEEGAHDEAEGPEDTLWAKLHAAEEYTLLLGDGQDLVTVDGVLHYRISDPYRYLYGVQNPEAGLRGAIYEALTRRTVGRSLDGVLSENLSVLADEVTAEARVRADEMDLGLEPVSFTLAGLHPPFAVARDYQAVVGARIERETAIIGAEAYRIRRVPAAMTEVQQDVDRALASAAKLRATAIGEAAAFSAVRESYAAEPDLVRFRRRMETLEANLAERDLTIVDRRFEAEGGQLWVLQ